MLCVCAPQVQAGRAGRRAGRQAGHPPVLHDDSPVGMGSNKDGQRGLAQP